jgi:alpha-tubulin suppressor-like RCC1 family protein
MAKLTRETQTVFGSGATTGQLKVFGSLVNGTPTNATNVGTGAGGVQNLSNFLSGWYAAMVGNNSFAAQDMNALCWLFSYQLAYLLQEGIAEYDASTTYYTNSIVQSNGVLYFSLQDSNTGNTPSSSPTFWQQKGLQSESFNSSGTFVAPTGVNEVLVQPILNYKAIHKNGFLEPALGILNASGSIYMWGAGIYGVLGNNSVTSVSSPVVISSPAGIAFKKLVIGAQSAITNCMFATTNTDQVYAWGYNASGQLGVGDQISRSTPTLISVGGSAKIIKVASDTGGNTFFLTESGDLYGCGLNTYGNLGIGNVNATSVPTLVLGGFKWSDVWAADFRTFGLTTSGSLYSWGVNINGELGLGDVTPRSSPVLVLGGIPFASVSLDPTNSGNPTLAITTSGAMYGWGINNHGQLGIGNVTAQSSPVLVLGGQTWSSVVDFAGQIIGLNTSGAAYVWGVTQNGNTSVPINTSGSSPVLVSGGLNFSKIDCVSYTPDTSLYGITTTGILYAWGGNGVGQLGVGDITSRSSPVLVAGGYTFDQVYAFQTGGNDQATILGVDVNGRVYAWGSSAEGVLGNGSAVTLTSAVSSPVLVLGGFIAQNSTYPGMFQAPSQPQVIPVIPGNSYTIVVSPNGYTKFGNTNIGFQIAGLTVVSSQ